MKPEDRELIKRFEEQANRAYQTNCYVTTTFLKEMEQDILLGVADTLPVTVSLEGGTDIAERKIAVFGDAGMFGYEPTLPVVLLHILPVARKFAETLSHRDVLGAVMNLGVERAVIGDIFVQEKEVYLFCLEQMAEYITSQLSRIRHTVVKVQKLPLAAAQAVTLAETSEERIVVASLRLDAVIAAVYHLSRKESLQYIRDRKVALGGRINENNSGLIKEQTMVTVRGKGRFFYEGVAYETKKGKYQLKIQRYH